jgi:hypothetical protein
VVDEQKSTFCLFLLPSISKVITARAQTQTLNPEWSLPRALDRKT